MDVSSWGKQFIVRLGLSVIITAKISSKFENLHLLSPDQPHRGLSHKFYYFQCSISKALFTPFYYKVKKKVWCHVPEKTAHFTDWRLTPAYGLMLTHRQPIKVPYIHVFT